MTVSPPTIRDEIVTAWRKILIAKGAHPNTVDVLVLELEQACEGHGAKLPRRPRMDDPNALALGPMPPPADPTVAEAAAAAARASLRPYGGTDTRTERPALERLPEPPKEPR